MSSKESLFAQLEQSPGDWVARIALIELAVRAGDIREAKRLVRASPSDVPTPTEIQVRLHTLLTRGIEALEAPPQRSAKDPVPVPPEAPSPPEPPESKTEAKVPERVSDDSPPRIGGGPDDGPKTDSDADATPPAARESTPPSTSALADAAASGGLGALVEAEPVAAPESRARRREEKVGSRLAAARGRRGSPKLERPSGREKWRDYDGGLVLADLDPPEFHERPSHSRERASSVSFALLAHIAILLLLSLVAVQVHRPDPPQLVVSTQHEREAELTTTRITRPNPEVKPSAAAAQALDVISALSASATFEVPEVEQASEVFVASALPGMASVGTGVSFSAEAVRSSDVNFFGLSGSGRRIVFVIDATPEMLVDEKGGMSAYDKVKEEIGAMLANLNRGTEFNLLLYQGKELVAFREEPVPGLPSNLRMAIEWLEPLNRDYDSLGLRGRFGRSLEVSDRDDLPIAAGDLAHYAKAVHKALEWQASAVFCITVGYRSMTRAPTPEMLERIARMPRSEPGAVDAREQRTWEAAVEKTRAWLEKENAARRERGLDPKVVVNFNQLVREVTGATPPSRAPAPAGPEMPRMPPVTPEDVEQQVRLLVKERYKAEGLEEPSVHIVLFLGTKEEIAAGDEDHFKSLTRKNRGKLKVLRGLSALRNVTGP
jgi:hypothetical protein